LPLEIIAISLIMFW